MQIPWMWDQQRLILIVILDFVVIAFAWWFNSSNAECPQWNVSFTIFCEFGLKVKIKKKSWLETFLFVSCCFVAVVKSKNEAWEAVSKKHRARPTQQRTKQHIKCQTEREEKNEWKKP